MGVYKLGQRWHVFEYKTGKDWPNCVIGCKYEDYDAAAQEYYINNGYVTNSNYFIHCKSSKHWLCRCLPEFHQDTGRAQTIRIPGNGKQPGKVSTHFLGKCYKHNLDKEELAFRLIVFLLFLYLTIFRCICIVFNTQNSIMD